MRPIHSINISSNISLKNYQIKNDFDEPKGMTPDSLTRLKSGDSFSSLINKTHIIKLANNFPANIENVRGDYRTKALTAIDLVEMSDMEFMGSQEYEIEDFIYCKNYGVPINRLITLRRFPYPVTENIYDKFNQAEPDIARMVTYSTQETNKLEDVLAFSYGLEWRELVAEFDSMSTIGNQSGFNGLVDKVLPIIDPISAQNKLRNANEMAYDPKMDSNRIFGEVDSIHKTHVRDVGLNFNKELELVFEYDLQAWGGRTPEFAMRDIIGNVLATTFNNGKFWGGSRYWVGERPSQFMEHFRKFADPKSIDEFFNNGYNGLKSAIESFRVKGSAVEALKRAMTNGLAMGIGKILDKIGRPSVVVMTSLLKNEPTGLWHVTIGNPVNPTMVIGNLILNSVDVKFNTDSLSYLDFPTKMTFTVRLKPSMPKDRSSAEMMFNMGKQRMYFSPKKYEKATTNNVNRTSRGWYNFDSTEIGKSLQEQRDFLAEKTVQIVNENYGNTKETAKQVYSSSKEAVSKFAEDTKKAIKDNSLFK